MISLPLIWKKHKHREQWDNCPHCEGPLKWIYDGFDWIPCDKEPVLFVMHPDGKYKLIYEKAELSNCLLFRKGDKRITTSPLWGHQQHYYTCPWLKARRADYVKNKGRIHKV